MIFKSVTAAAALLAIALTVRAGFTAPRRVPRNFNEGWNAFHAADARAGRPLYPPSGYFINNYPPLSFEVVALVTPLAAGDALVAGRFVALLAFIVWFGALAATARALGASPMDAVFGAALGAAMMLVRTDYYVGVSEPQILGHALQAIALWLVARRSPMGGTIAGVLFALSLFVKHNLLPLPLVTLAWLWWNERRAGTLALSSFAGTLFAASAVAWGRYGPAFLDQMSASRSYFPVKALSMTFEWLPYWLVAIATAAWLVATDRRDSRAVLVGSYAAAATAVGVLGFGGDGVYWNATFDAQAALVLAVALALSRVPTDGRRTALALACAAPLAASLATVADGHWLSPRFYVDPRWSEADAAAREIAFLRDRQGPSLCENLTLCFWAGKTAEVDFFDLQQRVRRDAGRADALADRVEHGEFAVVLLDDVEPRRVVGSRFQSALASRYRFDHASQWGAFFVPR